MVHMTTTRSFDRKELTALIISVGVLIAIGCYWVAQVLGVIEMLKLAYG